MSDVRRADYCVVGVAECFRGDGEIMANPIGTILAGAMMLKWIGDRKGDASLAEASTRIERAVETVMGEGRVLPRDVGGKSSTTEITTAICNALT